MTLDAMTVTNCLKARIQWIYLSSVIHDHQTVADLDEGNTAFKHDNTHTLSIDVFKFYLALSKRLQGEEHEHFDCKYLEIVTD